MAVRDEERGVRMTVVIMKGSWDEKVMGFGVIMVKGLWW